MTIEKVNFARSSWCSWVLSVIIDQTVYACADLVIVEDLSLDH